MKMLSNVPPVDTSELLKHFSDTYFSLRTVLAVLALSLPLILYFYGKWMHGLDLQPSMSAYFWAADSAEQCAAFPMRTPFVGFLCAVAAALYAYKGLTSRENLLLNAASICAILVAVFPERISVGDAAQDTRLALLFKTCPSIELWASGDQLPVHYTAAVLLFVFLAIVAWSCAKKSLEYLPPPHDRTKFERLYKALAILMILFPIPGIAVAYLFGAPEAKVFFIEAAGVWTFGGYWIVKGRELSLSHLEKDLVVVATTRIKTN